MIDVRVVWVSVDDRLMDVRMRMRLARRIVLAVPVPVVLIVQVTMPVGEGRMLMSMIVTLGHMKPDSEAHQERGGDQLGPQ